MDYCSAKSTSPRVFIFCGKVAKAQRYYIGIEYKKITHYGDSNKKYDAFTLRQENKGLYQAVCAREQKINSFK